MTQSVTNDGVTDFTELVQDELPICFSVEVDSEMACF